MKKTNFILMLGLVFLMATTAYSQSSATKKTASPDVPRKRPCFGKLKDVKNVNDFCWWSYCEDYNKYNDNGKKQVREQYAEFLKKRDFYIEHGFKGDEPGEAK